MSKQKPAGGWYMLGSAPVNSSEPAPVSVSGQGRGEGVYLVNGSEHARVGVSGPGREGQEGLDR